MAALGILFSAGDFGARLAINNIQSNRDAHNAIPSKSTPQELKSAQARIEKFDSEDASKPHKLVDPITGIMTAPSDVVHSIYIARQEEGRLEEVAKLRDKLHDETALRDRPKDIRDARTAGILGALLTAKSIYTFTRNRIRNMRSPKPTA
ncbi:MAG: hypothetical protein Q7R51_02175 [bacterium]|nr:hypothetical protein [bacterium]